MILKIINYFDCQKCTPKLVSFADNFVSALQPLTIGRNPPSTPDKLGSPQKVPSISLCGYEMIHWQLHISFECLLQ